MYISDVIERAKALHPTEYTTEEYIHWCDELSADIRRNYDIIYKSFKEFSDVVLLPEGVSINDVSKIIMDGRELDKTNLLDFGIDYEYEVRGRTLKKRDGSLSDFEIIYAEPHHPTRYIDVDEEVTFSDNKMYCSLPVFCIGDSVEVKFDGNCYTIHITDSDDGVYFFSGDAVPEGTREVHLTRVITEQTLLPAPYDTAYIDFVNAKAAMYQGDEAEYTSFMGQYNVKINDYRQHLTRQMPRKRCKFFNWW